MSVLFISVLQLINGTQFLNTTPISLLSACLAANNGALVLLAAVPASPGNCYCSFNKYLCITIIT